MSRESSVRTDFWGLTAHVCAAVGSVFILASVAHGETNPASIAVPLIGTSGVAAHYPSTIEVDAPGGPGQTGFVWVTLHNVTDPCPEDLAVLLVHNETAKYLLMANAGGCRPFQGTTIRFVSDWFGPTALFSG